MVLEERERIEEIKKNSRGWVWASWTRRSKDWRNGWITLYFEVKMQTQVGGDGLSPEVLYDFCAAIEDLNVNVYEEGIIDELFMKLAVKFPGRAMVISLKNNVDFGYTVEYGQIG